jgi:uncharacterized protein YaaN involved in tellurite resistance
MKITFEPVSKTKQALPDLGQPQAANIVAMPTKTSAVAVRRPEVQRQMEALRSVNRLTVSSFGANHAEETARLSDEVLELTTVSHMGEFGKQLTSIINLTDSVDPDDLNLDKSKGLMGKMTGMFKKSKNEVMSHFKTVSDQIAEISDKLEENVKAAEEQNVFLENMYEANLREYEELGYTVEALDTFKAEQEAILNDMKSIKDPTPMQVQKISDQEDFVNKIDKQADRLRRSQHMAYLTAPEIRRIQNGNMDSIDNLTVIREQTLPAWKKLMSLASMGQALQERLELGNTIMDKTNEMQRKLADLNGKNAIAAAKLSQRSSYDIETMKYTQKSLIESSRTAATHIEAGKKERAEAVKLIADMRDELRKEFAPKK